MAKQQKNTNTTPTQTDSALNDQLKKLYEDLPISTYFFCKFI